MAFLSIEKQVCISVISQFLSAKLINPSILKIHGAILVIYVRIMNRSLSRPEQKLNSAFLTPIRSCGSLSHQVQSEDASRSPDRDRDVSSFTKLYDNCSLSMVKRRSGLSWNLVWLQNYATFQFAVWNLISSSTTYRGRNRTKLCPWFVNTASLTRYYKAGQAERWRHPRPRQLQTPEACAQSVWYTRATYIMSCCFSPSAPFIAVLTFALQYCGLFW